MNNQQNFSDFSLNEFVWNDNFRKWVLSPDEDSDNFWKNWIKANSEKEAAVGAAKKIILALTIKEPELSDAVIAAEIQNILDEINRKEINSYRKNGFRTIVENRYWKLGLSAAVILIVAVTTVLWMIRKSDNTSISYQELMRSSDEKLTEKVNETGKPQTVLLPDGSKIVLEKNAKISFAASFNNSSKRKVYLSGTAFFEVAKNPLKPFLVYTNGLITKVLGTKFIIHSMDSNKKVSVEVISGIVSVYSYIDKRSNEETGSKKLNALILTANQKANYSSEDKTLMAAIVTNPVLVSAEEVNFKFEDTSIDSVFKSVEKGYGIDIVYDEKSLAKRTFTATLTTESMYEKMDIICKALNARYEIIDGKIVVYSNVSNQ